MSYPSTHQHELTTHYAQLNSALGDMTLHGWKLLKGAFYSTLLAVVVIALAMVGGTWMQYLVFAGAVLLIFGFELEEVTVANAFTATFATGDDDESGSDE